MALLLISVLVLVLNPRLTPVRPYNILGIFPHPGKSHLDVFVPLMRGLSEKGHNVTVISHLSLKDPPARYKDINLSDDANQTSLTNVMEINSGRMPRPYAILGPITHLQICGEIECQNALNSKSFQQFLEDNNTKFDVVISEQFNTDCFLGLVHKFQASLIAISSCPLLHWTSSRIANPTNPSYIPNTFSITLSNRNSFFERVENFLMALLHDYFYNAVTLPSDNRYSRKIFGENFPRVEEIAKRTSLVLVNTHFSLNLARPLVPGVVEIGGIHIGETKKPPGELDKWINESTHGVIYFSLGSMIKGHTFPEEKRSEFLKAFGRLPQRVLWKWENDTMPGQPANVRIQKWMPQLDILCHPNVKAFISHGGLLGVTEAVYCGVPIVVMPQYGDQHTNAKAVEANGGGVTLLLHEAKEENVYEALKTVLDPDFRRGAKELSARFRDRPLPPLETAIYWVEYVARHRGAHHMRTAAVDMPFYKYLLLDVIAFLVLVLVLAATVFLCVARALWRKLFAAKGTPPKQKTN